MAIGTVDNNGKRQISAGIAGVNDNDTVIETGDVSEFETHYFYTMAGAVDINVSLNGVNFSALIAFESAHSLTPATRVILTTGQQVYTFKGRYRNIRVKQSGATAATGTYLHSE